MGMRSKLLLLGAVLMLCGTVEAQNQFVIFKVKTPFDAGRVVPDSARLNEASR